MKFKLLHIIFSTLIVVAFGWGSTYLVMKGIELAKPSVVVVNSTEQKAAVTEMTVATASTSQRSVQDYSASPKNAENGITIVIGGDVMFDRGIRAIGTRNGYNSLFDKSVISLLQSADIALVNLEGPITSYPSKTLVDGKVTDSFTFSFHPLSRLSLKEAGIDIVSLANNHTDNMNLIGFIETQDWLEDAGILWFGNPWNSTSTKITRRARIGDDSPITKVVEVGGVKIAFVGYHAFQSGMTRVIEEIKRIEDPGVFTILMPHWGEEYTSKPSSTLKSQARAFIEAGADAVIGAHPHVIMDNEWVDDVPVYYSLGNLLFDQYFSKEVMKGLIVELHIINDGSKTYLDKVSTYENHLVKGVGTSLVEPQQ
jgi:poly-gamma-glutamate synthesis protein (capsule biosynthesis protein)